MQGWQGAPVRPSVGALRKEVQPAKLCREQHPPGPELAPPASTQPPSRAAAASASWTRQHAGGPPAAPRGGQAGEARRPVRNAQAGGWWVCSGLWQSPASTWAGGKAACWVGWWVGRQAHDQAVGKRGPALACSTSDALACSRSTTRMTRPRSACAAVCCRATGSEGEGGQTGEARQPDGEQQRQGMRQQAVPRCHLLCS